MTIHLDLYKCALMLGVLSKNEEKIDACGRHIGDH
jgi:hypothetical protein